MKRTPEARSPFRNESWKLVRRVSSSSGQWQQGRTFPSLSASAVWQSRVKSLLFLLLLFNYENSQLRGVTKGKEISDGGNFHVGWNNPGWGTVRNRNHSSPCLVSSERAMWCLIVPVLLPQDLTCFLSTCLKHKFQWERGGSLLGCKS